MRLTCMLLFPVAVLSGCLICTEIGCVSSAGLDEVSYEGSVVGATATACRNDVCADAAITRDPERTMVVRQPLGEMVLELRESGSMRAATLDFDSEPPADVTDGDEYQLSIVAADGTTVVSESWIVDYETFRPNGPSCPGECLVGRPRS